jgi:hypothetical protein
MTKLKLGPIRDDKSVKLTVELPQSGIATLSLMVKYWPERPDRGPSNRRSWLFPCSRDSWRRIGASPRRVDRSSNPGQRSEHLDELTHAPQRIEPRDREDLSIRACSEA